MLDAFCEKCRRLVTNGEFLRKLSEVHSWSRARVRFPHYRTNMESLLSVVGALFLGYQGLSLACQVVHGLRSFVLPALGIKKNLKMYHPWAGRCCSSVGNLRNKCLDCVCGLFVGVEECESRRQIQHIQQGRPASQQLDWVRFDVVTKVLVR